MLQVKASIEYVCAGDECEVSELFDVLQEMDRRYFLIQDLRWEFTMLDYGNTDTITEEHAKYILLVTDTDNLRLHVSIKFRKQNPGSWGLMY